MICVMRAIAELRAQIGVVTQEIQLFHATVRDNLTFFDRDNRATKRPSGTALDTLGLGDWCRALPEGLDTILASRAVVASRRGRRNYSPSSGSSCATLGLDHSR